MKRVVQIVLLLATSACAHASPEARILAAFREAPNIRVADNPERDTLAAKCGAPTTAVRLVRRDTAVVALIQDCIDRRLSACPVGMNCMTPQGLRFETDYLVLRKNGKWKVDRAIGGASILAG